MADKKITVRLDENTYYEFKKICVKFFPTMIDYIGERRRKQCKLYDCFE